MIARGCIPATARRLYVKLHRDASAAVALWVALSVILVVALPFGSLHAGPVVDGTACDAPGMHVAALQQPPGRAPWTTSIVVFGDTSNDDPDQHQPVATMGDTGTILGLAYDPIHNRVFAASHFQMGGRIGPGGPDTIYMVDPDISQTSVWVTLPAGGNELTGTIENMALVGRTGLGDIDIDPDLRILYVANIHQGRIYRVSTQSRTILGSFAHGAANAAWSADAHVFGLGVTNGYVYHGVVDTKEREGPHAIPDGFIYRSHSDGTNTELVARWSFGYRRVGGTAWRRWSDATRRDPQPPYGQPIVSDIDFTTEGDLVIGIRDRVIDIRYNGYVERWPQGDVLATRRADGRWEVLTGVDNLYVTESAHYLEAAQGMIAGASDGRFAAVAMGVAEAGSPVDDLMSGVLWVDEAAGDVVGHEALMHCPPRECYTDALGDVERFVCRRATPSDTPAATATTTATARVMQSATPTTAATPIARRPVFLPAVNLHDFGLGRSSW